MRQPARIHAVPGLLCGKPVVRGTRISVELILRKLSEGATIEGLLDAYSQLSLEDIRAAIAFAADLVADEGLIPKNHPEADMPLPSS